MATPRHRSASDTSYFVTTKCWQGRRIFQVPEIADILLRTIFDYRASKAYLLHEFVVMPDHLHLLLTPSASTTLEKAIQLVKGGSSHRIHRERNQRMEIWQQGFYDWTVRDANDWRTKVEYIRLNPVRAKLVERPQDWRYSSANGNFTLDSIPSRYLSLTSGAKAQSTSAPSPELKLRPPEEKDAAGHEGTTPCSAAFKAAKS
jgi:putative transposase